MKRSNKGSVLINIILLSLIIACVLFIVLIIGKSDNEVAYIDNEEPIREVIEKSNTKDEQVIENVELSNSIKNNTVNSNTSNNVGKKYYYNQLTSVGKSLYDDLVNNIEILKNGTQRINFETTSSSAGENVQSALDALFLDRPEIFWIDILKVSFATKTTSFLSSVKYSYYIEPKAGESNYLIDSMQTEQQVKDAISKVEARINNIAVRASGTTYDKVKFVHNEIVNEISYDENLGINSSNMYGALIENKCVCEGYAESFKAIMDVLDIPCVIVYGDGVDSDGNTEAHAWNYVKMDNGKWYAIDTTWDDPIIIGGDSSGVNRYQYFLKGSTDFFKNHREDGNVSGEGQIFEYPTLSETDYS